MGSSAPSWFRLRQTSRCRRRTENHPLTGDWDDCRECHVRPDLLLVYRKPDADVLQLVRLGSHTELFG